MYRTQSNHTNCPNDRRCEQHYKKLSENASQIISGYKDEKIEIQEQTDLSFTGTICVRLSNGMTTYVSRRYVPKLKKILGI